MAGALADAEGFIREWDARLAAMRARCLDLSDAEAARYQSHLRTLAAKLETLRSRWDERGLSPIPPPEVVERIREAQQALEAACAAAPAVGPLSPR